MDRVDAAMMVEIEVPAPDRLLSPNARIHHMVKAKAVKAAREMATLAARSVLANEPQPWLTGRVLVTGYVLWGPGRRAVDYDNLIAMLKPTLDGLQGVVYANDRQIAATPRLTQGTTTQPGGLLHLTIRSLADGEAVPD